jgi:hypothetical protein
MQVKLVFDLPEEQDRYMEHINGPRAHTVLRNLHNRIRGDIKHGEWHEQYEDALEDIYKILYLELSEEGVDLY